MNNTIKKKIRTARYLLLFYLVAFVVELLAPLSAFALTSGPSQPEVQSFEPVGTTDMVNLFSGDFNYNIPLFELPGPNGGYPFNLAYHGGITMDEEASWVGLGWNLNPGVINRNMRGLPDDFSGDLVKTDLDIKKNWTVGLGVGFNIEPWTFDLKKGQDAKVLDEGVGFNVSLGVKYNSYTGFGTNLGFGANVSTDKNDDIVGGAGLGMSLNSDEGASFNVDVSLNSNINNADKKEKHGGSVGLGVNSRVGLKALSLGFSSSRSEKVTKEKSARNYAGSGSGSISFSSPSFTPRVNMPMKGFDVSVDIKGGGTIGGVLLYAGVNGFYSEQKLRTNLKQSKAYGYLHLQDASEKEYDETPGTLMDVNREKDAMVTRFTPNLSAPHLTYDVFSVVGQGMMNMYRPYRNDIGATFDEYTHSQTTGGGLGIEVGPGTGDPVWAQVGINAQVNHSESWSGKWTERNDFAKSYTNNVPNVDYENVFYRSTGELTAEDPSRMQGMIGGDQPLKIDLDGPRNCPKLTNNFSNQSNNAMSVWDNVQRMNVARKPRANSLSTFTNDQLSDNSNRARLNEFRVNYFGSSVLSSSSVGSYKSAIFSGLPVLDRQKRNGYQTDMSIKGHIGGIEAVNNDGMRYVYAIPAYNTKQIEATFSVKTGVDYCKQKVKTDVSGGKLNYKITGTDEYLQKTSMPPYAHSYLLTSVLGSDYVDIDNNGPSDDDFGYWVKFDYVKSSDAFKWRAPYEYDSANFSGGYRSDEYDNKGNYMYGEKEIWYLATAETKTHIAVFILSPRHDGLSSAGEVTSSTKEKSYKIDRIELYSKEEYKKSSSPKPLQTVHLAYDYSLCGNVSNNDGVPDGSLNTNKGKLTLKSLYFTYENSSRGALSPYLFEYGNLTLDGSAITANPNYDGSAYDRWGMYKPDGSNCDRVSAPYTNQGGTTTDIQNRLISATAWNLTDIHLPSGANIHVNYEMDDYAFVQDKVAMQMYKIEGLGLFNPSSPGNNDKIYTDDSNRHANDPDERKIYFKLKSPLSIGLSGGQLQAELDKYLDDTRQLYFKVFAPMKGDGSMMEYTSGYLEIESIGVNEKCKENISSPSNYLWAYVQVKQFEKNNGTKIKYHPLTYAILQALKLNLPQYAYKGKLTTANPSAQGKGLIIEMLKSMGAMFSTVKEFFIGYYNDKTNSLHKWADRVDLDHSFIRLNCPNKIKFGGGIRVSEIAIDDQWNSTTGEQSSKYGQAYTYTTTDDDGSLISSGVATFEPAIGGEENALRYAKKYPQRLSVNTENSTYYEYPINESVYPAPSIGYSKVTVSSLNTKKILSGVTSDVGYSSTGVTENYFYTAKDYPIVTSETTLDPNVNSKSFKYLNLPIPIPGIGSLNWDVLAASQGYVIQLNDMHGKPWKTLNYGIDAHGHKIKEPISSVQYEYFDEVRQYLKPGTNKVVSYRVLKSEVPVVISDPDPAQLDKAKIATKSLGVDYEMFTDQRQSQSYSVGGGVSFNIDLVNAGFPIPVPIPWPNVNYSANDLSVAVTNKIISRTGILKRTIATDGQSIVTTENKCFDKYSGAPLLTTVTNDFNENIWKYDIPADLKYENMGPAYQNADLLLAIPADSISHISTEPDSIYTINWQAAFNKVTSGDELFVAGTTPNSWTAKRAIVVSKEDSVFSIVVLNGLSNPAEFWGPGQYYFKIYRSGNRNLLNAKAGSLTALKDPTTGRIIQTCENNFAIPKDIAPIMDTCMLEFDMAALFDTLKSLAGKSVSENVYISLADTALSSVLPSVGDWVNKGYVAITMNLSNNQITFVNMNGNNCSWVVYVTWQLTPTSWMPPVPVALENLEGNYLFPLGGCWEGLPSELNGAILKGCHSYGDTYKLLLYQTPANCFCEAMYNPPLTFDTIQYTDTLIVLDSIINSSATTYTDNWPNDFGDIRFSENPAANRTFLLNAMNDFVNGRKGIWRNWMNYAYHTDRKQNPDSVKIYEDGTYQMTMFDWRNPILPSCDPNWIKANEITMYNAYNYDVENKDALGIYSAALYGYNGKLPIAVGSNTKYEEFAFEGFEEQTTGEELNQFEVSTGNLSIYNLLADMTDCNSVFISRLFIDFRDMCIYNYDPQGATSLTGVKIHYAHGHGPVGFAGAINISSLLHRYGEGNLSNMYIPPKHQKIGTEACIATYTSTVGSISLLPIWGLIDIPVCVPIPGSETPVGDSVVYSQDKAHTGKVSVKIKGVHEFKQFFLKLEPSKKYEFSAWVSRGGSNANISTYLQSNSNVADDLQVQIIAYDEAGTQLGGPIATFMPGGYMVNKWQKIEGSFTSYNPATKYVGLKITSGKVSGSYASAYFDDLRIFPSTGNMVSYVYDKDNYRLKATLDNNNYATFFYYDESGKLYLKKQETERGVFTVQESKVHTPE